MCRCNQCCFPFAPFDPNSDDRRRVWEEIIHCTPTRVHKPPAANLCVAHVRGCVTTGEPITFEDPVHAFPEGRASDDTPV